MKPNQVRALQDAASILMVCGAEGSGPMEEAALGLSANLNQWLCQRLRADAQHANTAAAARRAVSRPAESAAVPLRKTG